MALRCMGWIPSPPEKVGLGHPSKLSAAPVPKSGEVLLPPPVDQGPTSSCTGNATAVAICTAIAQGGEFPELPSRLFLYYCARALEGDPLTDNGAVISDLFEVAARLGFPPESAWPFSTSKFDLAKQPDFQAFRLAADQKLIKGAYRLASEGLGRVADVKRAIAAGHPVVWGTLLDLQFEQLDPGNVWPGLKGAAVGGHAMVLHKFDGDVFWTRSSWGDWCEGGSARVSANAISSSNADDFWIVELADGYSK